MEGDEQGGFSVFWADDGLDTGPILLQKSVDIDPNETVDSLYNRFLYPEGIKSMVCGFIISKIKLKKECLYRSQQKFALSHLVDFFINFYSYDWEFYPNQVTQIITGLNFCVPF